MIAALSLAFAAAGPLAAQPDGDEEYRDAESIRRDTREVFSSREFDHVRKLAGELDEPEPVAPKAPKPRESSFRLPRIPGADVLAQGLGAIIHLLAWLSLGLVCGVILYLIIRTIMNYERSPRRTPFSGVGRIAGEIDEEHAPGDIPADVYLARATDLARQGLYREAVAQLLLGAMGQVERMGLIRHRRGLTYRDYLRAVRAHEQRHSGLRAIVRVYEPIGFGRRPASASHFEESLEGYRRGFHESV